MQLQRFRGALLTRIVLLGLAVLMPAAAGALTLDVEQAVSLALENNLQLKTERIDLQTASRTRQAAWNVWLPSINASAAVSRLKEVASAYGVSRSPWNLNLSFEASLYLSPAIPASIRATVLEYEGGQLTYETARRQVERDVRQAFYSLLVYRESINLAEQELATAQHRYQQTLKNYEAGLTPRLQVLSARVAAENLKPALEKQRASYSSSLMSFQQLLGLDTDEEVELDGAIETRTYRLDPERLVQEYVNQRLDIQGLQKQIQILENTKKLQSAANLGPTLSISGSLGPAINDPFGADWASGDSWMDGGSLTLAVQVPLDGFLPGSASRVQLSELDDSIQKARLSLEQARQQGAVEIRSIVLQLGQSLRAIEALDLNVTLAQEAYDLTAQAYRAGTEQLLEVQNASDELQKTRLSLLSERYTYLSGLLDLEYALNTPLTELEAAHD